MSRVKRSVHGRKKRRETLERAKGYRGQASKSYLTSPMREYRVKYRRPYGTEWEELALDEAMDMIVDRVITTRKENWQELNDDGLRVNRTRALANLGGATLDNEENYLMKKLLSALGVVQVENQARI